MGFDAGCRVVSPANFGEAFFLRPGVPFLTFNVFFEHAFDNKLPLAGETTPDPCVLCLTSLRWDPGLLGVMVAGIGAGDFCRPGFPEMPGSMLSRVTVRTVERLLRRLLARDHGAFFSAPPAMEQMDAPVVFTVAGRGVATA